MAIKGKGKTRRRTVTGGPKPVYVEPPRPLWRRRWFQLTTAAVVVVGVAVALTSSLLVKGANDRKQKERNIVGQFSTLVVGAMQPIATPFQDSYIPFPDLTRAFSQLQGGGDNLDTGKIVTTANSNAKLALQAFNAISQIPTSDLVAGHPGLLDLIDAQNFLTQSLKLYQQVAEILKDAAQATGDERTTLVTQAQGLLPVGATLFQDGFQKINNLKAELGIPAPLAPPPAPGSLTGPTGPTAATGPTGATAPTTAPSGKASPKPKGSGSPKPQGSGSPKPKPTGSPTG